MLGPFSYRILAICCYAVIGLGHLATGARDIDQFLPRNTINIQKADVDFFTRSGREYYESIQANPKTRVIVYTILNADGDRAFIVDDFIKNIRVVRDINADHCKATDLMEENNIPSGEEFARLATDTNGTFVVQEFKLEILDPKPIGEADLLSPEALSACKGLPMYWSGPKGKRHRIKRAKGWWWWKKDECESS